MVGVSDIIGAIARWLTRQPRPEPAPLANLIDRRGTAAQAHGPKGAWKVGRRSWAKTTGICLHQTACVLGERPARWDTVGCHVGITRNGKIIWLHDFDRVVAHGNGWNAQTVGIEIDGLFAGVEGNASTVWNDPDTATQEVAMQLTAEQVIAARDAIRWIHHEVAKNGGKLTALVAHRQSSKSRRNDPGSEVWEQIALPMQNELGLSDGGAGFKIDDGRPIPEAWNPKYKRVLY